MDVDFSKTYLYNLHQLTNLLDKAFDSTLRQYTNTSLSQFVLLLAVKQEQPASQRTLAEYLGKSPAAISRQIDLASREKLLTLGYADNNQRKHTICITKQGQQVIKEGLSVLEKRLIHIFTGEDQAGNLMSHIDRLLTNTKGVIKAQTTH